MFLTQQFEAIMLVLLVGGIYDGRRRDDRYHVAWYTVTSFTKTDSDIQKLMEGYKHWQKCDLMSLLLFL
jgi:hypothetical protein